MILTTVQQLMQELGGGSGGPPARIEAGPGSYNSNGNGDAKPWQRGPTGGPAPWRNRSNDSHNDGGSAAPWARDRNRGQDNNQSADSYYGQGYGGSAAAPPWQQQAPGTQGGYAGYPGYPGYAAPPGMGAPPGLPTGGAGLSAPPGLGNINALIQQYAGAAPPPPPPSGDAPPPPPSDQPPPPPPGA